MPSPGPRDGELLDLADSGGHRNLWLITLCPRGSIGR